MWSCIAWYFSLTSLAFKNLNPWEILHLVYQPLALINIKKREKDAYKKIIRASLMLHIPCQQRRMQQSLLQVPKWRWQSKIPWTRRKWRGIIIKNYQSVLKNKYSVQNIDIKASDPMLQLLLCYHYLWSYTLLPSVCLLTSHPREQNSKVSKKYHRDGMKWKGLQTYKGFYKCTA